MGEDGEYCWNSISCEQLRQVLESPWNRIWYKAKAWVTTRTAWFTALTSSLDADDAFTVISKKNSKTPTAGNGRAANDDPGESHYALLDQSAMNFQQLHEEITMKERERREQSWKLLRSNQQNVANRKR